MPEPSRTSTLEGFKFDSLHVAVEWLSANGQKECLCQITLNIEFNAASGAAALRVKASVEIKGFPSTHKLTLSLHIPGDRISSLVWFTTDKAPQIVGTKSGDIVTRLDLSLSRPADMVVPRVDSWVPRTKSHGHIIDCLKLLAQTNCFSIYLARSSVPADYLQALCNAVANGILKPTDSAANMRSDYEGLGCKILEGDELCIPGSSTVLPLHGELGPMPPHASEMGSRTASPAKKRRRDSDLADEDDAGMAFIRKMIETMLEKSLKERRVDESTRQMMKITETMKQMKRDME